MAPTGSSLGDNTCAASNELLSAEQAALLPRTVRFGTSTWSYPGWQGLVYHRQYRSSAAFKRECLTEYGAVPFLRTVGIDSTFYAPPSAATLQRYVSQVPDDFRFVSKVWEELTIPCFPAHPRYKAKAGRANPLFLQPEVLLERVLPPFDHPDVRAKVGVFILQFPYIAPAVLAAGRFFELLESFLSALPRDRRFAVEVRNAEYLTPAYFALLNRCGNTHCFNHWNTMPSLRAQMESAAAAGGLSAGFMAARILTPLGVDYAAAVRLFQPYNTLKRPNLQMRRDAVTLARRAVQRNAEVFIIVNNRAEGNAPLTISAIAALLLASFDASTVAPTLSTADAP